MKRDTMKERVVKALDHGDFLDIAALAALTDQEPKTLRRYLRLFIADGTVQKRGNRGCGVRYGVAHKEVEHVPVP